MAVKNQAASILAAGTVKSLLLFFPVKDGGQRLVCMCCVTVQVCHILFLALRIPDGDIPGRHCRLCGTVRMAFMICTDQQIVCHVPQEISGNTATGTEPCTLMFRFKVGPVFNITEAQCAGIQPVFICRCRGRNHRTVQLRMLSGGDIKPAPAGKNPRLLLYTVVVTVHFIPAEVHTRRTAHGPESEAASGAGILLLTVCCVGLTFILNFYANNMADVIEATVVVPASRVDDQNLFSDLTDSSVEMEPSIESQQARTDFRQISILYMLLVIAAGGGLTWFFVGGALTPLKVLNSRMKSCTANNLSQQLPVPQTHDEVAELTVSFNQMSSKLDQAFAMQRRFAQSAAHELRTPLTGSANESRCIQKTG